MDNSSTSSFPKLEVSNRQPKFLGPLLGLFLANLLSNSVLAKFSPLGSIRLQYDPLPLASHHPPSVNIYQTTDRPGFHPITQRPEDSHIIQYEPIETEEHNHSHPDLAATNIGPADYIISEESKITKTPVKRGIYYRDSASFRRNRYSSRRRYTTPDYFDDDSYEDFTTRRYKPRRRTNGKRPINFDDEYYDDYDYSNRVRNQQRRNRYKNKNRRQQVDPDYYSDENFRDEVERVTVRPRQQVPTTTMNNTEATTPMTNITTGVPENTTNTTTAPTGYGYGPSSGNENISITYSPPYAQKPLYGPPNIVAGSPISEWRPSTLYGFSSSGYGFSGLYGTPSVSYATSSSSYATPHTGYGSSSTNYGTPSQSYGPPSTSYGTPVASYGTPSTLYGSPSTQYGSPSSQYGSPSSQYGSPSSQYGSPSTQYGSPSSTYGSPSSTYGSPSTSYSSPSATYGSPGVSYPSSSVSGGYSSYQLPYTSWYKKGSSHSDIVRRAQEIISFDR